MCECACVRACVRACVCALAHSAQHQHECVLQVDVTISVHTCTDILSVFDSRLSGYYLVGVDTKVLPGRTVY